MSDTAEPRYVCPVCGYPGLDEPARTAEDGPSYEICVSCGFEFGYDDDQGWTYEQWRQRWSEDGMPFRMRRRFRHRRQPPPGWDPATQLLNLLGDGPQDGG